MAAVSTRGTSWCKRDTFQAQAAGQGRGLLLTQGGAGDNYRAVAGANAVVIGVQEEPSVNAGDPISAIELGDAIAIAGAALASGIPVKSNGAGQCVPVTAVADNIAGYTKSSAAAAGDEVVILVVPSVNG